METCPNHERSIERISIVESKCEVGKTRLDAHEADIDVLFNSRDKHLETLQEMRLCMQQINMTMEEGFRKQTETISDIRTEITSLAFTVKNDVMVTLSDHKKSLDDLANFDWFRNFVNRWKEKLPWKVLMVPVMLLIFLAALHSVSIGDWIRKALIKMIGG
ncbi:MAG: hypothetical protein CSYNP_03559 [Syntrophus sp. SKADARSKE-3]|nr:hypothetical protein [Syntrophus sp. SKADARSKE-3]